jgi:hypothetical protein
MGIPGRWARFCHQGELGSPHLLSSGDITWSRVTEAERWFKGRWQDFHKKRPNPEDHVRFWRRNATSKEEGLRGAPFRFFHEEERSCWLPAGPPACWLVVVRRMGCERRASGEVTTHRSAGNLLPGIGCLGSMCLRHWEGCRTLAIPPDSQALIGSQAPVLPPGGRRHS